MAIIEVMQSSEDGGNCNDDRLHLRYAMQSSKLHCECQRMQNFTNFIQNWATE
jgi:hypothetical protein